MNAEFWLERWQKNEIGFHQQEVNSHLQAYWPSLQLPPGSRVFVPLCGKSRDLLWLCGQGHSLLGIEISPIAVRDFFDGHALTPLIEKQGPFERWAVNGLEILQGDFFNLRAPALQNIAGVFDRASLIALPPAMRQRYVRHLLDIVPPHARMLLVTLEYDQAMMDGPPFSVSAGEVDELYQIRYAITPLFEREVLDEYPMFRSRGLQQLHEKVFLLNPI